MVPDKFNMVDMGGIDLIMMQGEEVPGLYDALVESITQCSYQCLYNWMFDGITIPPTYVRMEVDAETGNVKINEGVEVTDEDVIQIYSIEPGPVDPEIIPLLAEENGVYNVPIGIDGFSPVTVDVPIYVPVINPITITENGVYSVPTGVDGYSPVTVNVSITGGISVRFTTRYTGGSNASVDVYRNELFVKTVSYSDVSAGAYEDFDFIRFMYNPTAESSPDGQAHQGWCVFALNSCTYNNSPYSLNQLVATWPYSSSVTVNVFGT